MSQMDEAPGTGAWVAHWGNDSFERSQEEMLNGLKRRNTTESSYHEIVDAGLTGVAPGSYIDHEEKPVWVDANHKTVLDLAASV